jgi:NADH-quinone oxidoreductase subunit E
MADNIDEIIGKYSNAGRSDLLDALQEIQEYNGFLSEDAIVKLSKHFNLSTTKIYGIASFYDRFRFVQYGKFHIKVCNGTACHLSDSKPVIKELEKLLRIKPGQTTRDAKFSLEVVPCMGSCGLSPVISINNEYYASIKTADIRDILENLKKSDS